MGNRDGPVSLGDSLAWYSPDSGVVSSWNNVIPAKAGIQSPPDVHASQPLRELDSQSSWE